MNDDTNPDDTYTVVRLTEPGESIGALSIFLGIHPVRSLVLVPYASTRRRVESVIRVDLPFPDDVPALVSQLRLGIRNISAHGLRGAPAQRLDNVAAVVVDNEHPVDAPLPHSSLIEALTVELTNDGIQLNHPVWTSATTPGEYWRCYAPCRCRGVVPDMTASVLAVAHTVAGRTPPRSRDHLAAILAADPADQLAHRATLLARRRANRTYGSNDIEDAALQVVRTAIAAAAARHNLPELDNEQIADIVIALDSPHVRGECVKAALSDQPEGAERLWTLLTRATPPPDRAEPAFHLAVHAALRGEGVLANIALGVAMAANPHHRATQLLHLALRAGITPTALRHVLAESITPSP